MPFIEELQSYFSDSQLLLNDADRKSFEVDWRGRYQGSSLAVVFPKSVVEVSWLVQCCRRHQIAIVPQSGNTSLCGGSVPISTIPSIIVNLSKLNAIRKIDLDNNTLTVESGVILETLSTLARQHNRLFPLSMASEGSAQIGGIISTNAGGTAVIRYGNMRSHILGLEVVLANGEIWNGLSELRKNNTGYDLKQLFIGAEGTLGIITAATLTLSPLPKSREVYWLSTDTLKNAVNTLTFLKERVGEQISAFEILSSECLRLVKKHFPQQLVPENSQHNWAILVELEHFNEQPEPNALFIDCIEQHLIKDAIYAINEQQQQQFWAIREHIPLAEKSEGFSIKHDISLPISALPEFVEKAVARVNALVPGVINVCFGHLGDGNLHFNFTNPSSLDKEVFLSLTPSINTLIYDLVAEYQGSLSAEHGIGQLKIKDLQKYKDPVELALMKTIKVALDPTNIMNPGKLLTSRSS